MKKVLSFLFALLFTQYAYSATCVDLPSNVSRFQENANVLALQNFLFEKGYLKATPNGYFGGGTFTALRAYQRDNAISQTGTAGPLTRAKLKADSCGQAGNAPSSQAKKQVTTAPAPVIKQATSSLSTQSSAPLAVTTKNQRRWRDAEVLLRGIYQHIVVSRGTWPPVASSTATNVELCAAPRITQMASSGEVTVVVTPDSPCKGVFDVAFLSPNILSSIPRDPNLATTSTMLGYTFSRGEYGDITIAPKTTDDKEMIRVRCNFDTGCKTVTRITSEEFGVPFVNTLSRTILLRDALPKEGITVSGRNFTASNTVFLLAKNNQRLYEVGTFPSNDGKTFVIAASTTVTELRCGQGCRERLPIGDYSVQIKNQGGESNIAYLFVRGFTTSSISSRANSTVTASSTNVKIGTITVSTSLPGTLKSLTLKATSSSSRLPGKITNFKLKDLISNRTINGSGLTFDLSSIQLPENNSRYYDVFADFGNILVDEAGYIEYGGSFLMNDTLGKVDIELPIKEIVFSASPF